MATMTTGHSLSVLTNSSVKPPRNPKTGLSTSLHERSDPLSSRFSGVFYDDYNDDAQVGKEILETRTKFATANDPYSLLQLGNLSDEEFYLKLLELKNEQRKILEKCEKIYIEKHNGDVSPTFSGGNDTEKQERVRNYQTLNSKTNIDEDGVLLSTKRSQSPLMPERSKSPELSGRSGSPALEDTIRDSLTDSYSKPTSGRPPLPATAKSLTSPFSRPRSAPLPRYSEDLSYEDLRNTALGLRQSYDEDGEEFVPDDTVSEPYNTRDISKRISQLQDMWQDFSIDDYAPRRSRQERRSSATITKKEKKEKDDSWRHRLTIPQPFTMTLREEKKEKKKSKTMMEFEEKHLRKEMDEEKELKKKFKARHVPAHVYLPLFDEIQEQQEHKRRHLRQSSAEMLKSQEKPFSFMKREDDRKKHQLMERECNQEKVKQERPKSATFKAKPVPKQIFDKAVDEKILEEEEYRKIRMKMRAEELLRASALPPSMSVREQMKEQKEKQQKLKSKKKAQRASSARPRINHEVPDYDNLYRQFQQELQRRKNQREGTVAKPFRLEGHRGLLSQEKVKRDIERDEETLKENRWPYKLPRTKPKNLGHMSLSLDSLPSKSTRAADARQSKTRNNLQQLTQRELREIEEDRRRRVKEMRLRRTILQSSASRETPRETPEEKKKKYREQERARVEEYEREMKEMKERVNRRPLLFEQESKTNAKKSAEKKFNATLRSVGLDEEFIQSRGSRSCSVHDDLTDNYDDDFEDTAVRYQDETYTKQESDRSQSPMEA